MPSSGEFEKEYQKLNKAQKEAVDTIEGPVMVVAGPGTGKTQILALRIANILQKTDYGSGSILCLTFTNSAVRAMRERLQKYIGAEASKVAISTFHSFGMDMLDQYHMVLGLSEKPELLDEKEAITLTDEILQGHEWQTLRPRSDPARHFRDLKSLLSFLKKERITPEDFERETELEIKNITKDPENISSRGESKGKLKKEAEKKIESLSRTLEAVKFYGLYEAAKKDRNLFDFDDILESLVRMVEESNEVKDHIKENFLYILIDEHQDSSGIQNEFLEKVWGKEEKPNIFVVGDDRQLIYGFGGASLEYFENFKHAFGKAKLITLLENYRSTQKILDSAHLLLESSIVKGKLKSNHPEDHAVRLVEAYYPHDEIIFSAFQIKEKIKKGHDANDMAILVPKNRQVESAVNILRGMGIPVAGGESMDFFDVPEAVSFLRVLKILADPSNGPAFAASFFDKLSGISPFKAHEFLKKNNMREFSLLAVAEERNNLFESESEGNNWSKKLKSWLEASNDSLYPFIQKVGSEFLLETAGNHQELVSRIEVLRTVLHLALHEIEKNPKITLAHFLTFVDRIASYGEKIPLAIFAPNEGVKVLTLHGSKGLEFDYVWIAHMDERSFAGAKRDGFSLPVSLKAKVEKKDELTQRRELYVAMTRAKRFCTISYALKSYTGGEQELAGIVADLSKNLEKQLADETEKIILKNDPKAYVAHDPKDEKKESIKLEKLAKLVAKDYEGRKVSVSLLNNFFECPWKWYFRNLLQLPEPKNESLEFGNAIHFAIDRILKLKKIPSEKELMDMTNDNKEILKVVSAWVKNRLPEIAPNRENEQSVSLHDGRFPHLSIYGKIDLIEKLDTNNIRVTDFKTGGVRKKSDIEKLDEEGRLSGYLRQLAMYSYLIKQSPKWKTDVRESRLEFVEAKNPAETFYDTVISDEEIEAIVKDITDYDRLVKEGEWLTRPCNYNSYGKNTECEYCQMAKIYR